MRRKMIAAAMTLGLLGTQSSAEAAINTGGGSGGASSYTCDDKTNTCTCSRKKKRDCEIMSLAECDIHRNSGNLVYHGNKGTCKRSKDAISTLGQPKQLPKCNYINFVTGPCTINGQVWGKPHKPKGPMKAESCKNPTPQSDGHGGIIMVYPKRGTVACPGQADGMAGKAPGVGATKPFPSKTRQQVTGKTAVLKVGGQAAGQATAVNAQSRAAPGKVAGRAR